jgi:hypothetical protein
VRSHRQSEYVKQLPRRVRIRNALITLAFIVLWEVFPNPGGLICFVLALLFVLACTYNAVWVAVFIIRKTIENQRRKP